MAAINPEELFTAGIKRPGVGFFYTLGLLAVTVVMAILPLIYMGLIALVIYGTYYHAQHSFAPLMTNGLGRGSGRLWAFKLFLYITPIFMGTVLAFFMVKPFFARQLDQHQPYAVNPEAEPALYDFVRRICAIVGAPMPSLIELDCSINAGAGFRRGFASFFGNDLILQIGLPLVAGLDVREFAGIIAHELGHFTQGVAMRLHYIINRIDGWFARLIWERDSWDEWLEEMAAEEEGWGSTMAVFAQLGVWFSRRVLTLLLLIGHAFSCFLSRRQEFHADQFEIRVGGSAAFERATARMELLNALNGAAMHQMRITWNLNKRLPDNLPQFIVNMDASQTGAHVKKALKGELGFVTTGWFHTHPSNADRVRAARLANAPGIVASDAPASDLFENFPVPAKIVTMLFYEGLGFPIGMAKIYEVEVPQQKSQSAEPEVKDTAEAAVDRFFSGVITALRPVFPKAIPKIADEAVAETLATIQALPAQISAVSDAIGEACLKFDNADQMMLAAAAEQSGTAEGADVATWREEREQARRALRSVVDAYEQRISSALALAETDAFGRACATAAQTRQRAEHGSRSLRALAPILKLVDEARVTTALLVGQSQDENVVVARLREMIADVEAGLREITCPFPLGTGSSLFDYFKALPVAQDPFLVPRANGLAELTMAAYTRILGEMALLAEEIVEQMNVRPVMRVGAA